MVCLPSLHQILLLQYASLIRTLAETLDMKEIPRTRDGQSAQATQLITNRIVLLKDRISRKEELLAGYENDLSKLRLDPFAQVAQLSR